MSEEDGAQVIRLETELPGKVLLHWGVQRNENDSWALPDDSSRPEGTLVYRSRALQTPWRCVVSLMARLQHHFCLHTSFTQSSI